MNKSTKIIFRYKHIRNIDDITDIVGILFPGNQNQQYAAARILLELKEAKGLLKNMSHLRRRRISKRTLERTRAKLSRLGLIERISWMNCRYNGDEGFKLSSRFSRSLRLLADKIDGWRRDKSDQRKDKDNMLTGLLQIPQPANDDR
jgi:hypothetical protein